VNRTTVSVLLALVLAFALSGCGGGAAGSKAGAAPGSKSAITMLAAESQAVDHEAAEAGEALFKTRGCSACHAFGKRVTGPDLAGVASRRSRQWITSMVRHPDTMTKEDSTARALFGTYMVQMPNLQLTEVEAHTVVEYFKSQEIPGEAGGEK
jgi:mono/diheme cytochrome c family protein